MIIARIIGRTRTTLSLLVLMVFVGLAARSALPIANDPHVDLPLFYVGVSHDGISPEDAERLLVQPMEIPRLMGAMERSRADVQDHVCGRAAALSAAHVRLLNVFARLARSPRFS